MKIFKEFKEFAVKGNAFDLAIGVIIGAAFGAITSSLVDDIVMPPLSVLTGNVDFESKRLILQEGATEAETIALGYGAFIDTIIEFLIIAFAVFLLVRWINRLREDRATAEDTPTPSSKKCPYCQSEIPNKAVRCPNCTSDFSESRP